MNFLVIIMNHKQKNIINHINKIKDLLILLIKKIPIFIVWIIWDFSGVRFIWQKIRPPIDKSTNKRLPATFLLWVVSIYLILFGVTSQRYENRVDIIENRANAILIQLSAPADSSQFRNAISRIPAVQNMSTPSEPNILKPKSVFASLLNKGNHQETVALLQETLVDFKENLSGMNLYKVNLQGTCLIRTIFDETNLEEAEFQKASLVSVDFKGSNLANANFQNANLQLVEFLYSNTLKDADFQNADLWTATFKDIDLSGVKFHNAWLEGAYFINVGNLTIEQLSEARTLYKATFDKKLMDQMKESYPHLFEEPTKANIKKIIQEIEPCTYRTPKTEEDMLKYN